MAGSRTAGTRAHASGLIRSVCGRAPDGWGQLIRPGSTRDHESARLRRALLPHCLLRQHAAWPAHPRQPDANAGIRGRHNERLDELGVEGDVALVLGVPLHADDPPARVLPLEGLDEAVGRQRAHSEAGGELANALVVVAVDPNLALAVDVFHAGAGLH